MGAQVKEHRTALDTRMDGVQATLQNVEQTLAKFQTEGGHTGNFVSSQTVSAQVLADADSSLEDLRSGRIKSVRMSLPTLQMSPQAATITSSDVYPTSERDSEVYGPMRRPLSIRDLLVNRRTSASAIEYLRVTRTGIAAIQAVEGDQKTELALNFSLESAGVKTIACWIPASRQALDDSTMLGDYIDIELRDSLQLAEDAQLLKGSGVGANILGLMTVASAYSRAQTGDTPSDTLRRAITQVQLPRGVVSGVVISPQGLERLELEKELEGRYLFAYSVTDANGRATVWRVPAVVTDVMGASEFMVSDFVRAARLYDRMQATVEIATQHADFFTRNLVAILAEERLALTVNRPDLLVIGAFAPAA